MEEQRRKEKEAGEASVPVPTVPQPVEDSSLQTAMDKNKECEYSEFFSIYILATPLEPLSKVVCEMATVLLLACTHTAGHQCPWTTCYYLGWGED